MFYIFYFLWLTFLTSSTLSSQHINLQHFTHIFLPQLIALCVFVVLCSNVM